MSRIYRVLPVLLASVLLNGCYSATRLQFDRGRQEAAFEAIRSDSHRGDFSRARDEARRAYTAWQTRPDTAWHWRFRLLYAELLLLNGDTRQASALISASPPARFSALMTRCEMLRGYVAFRDNRAAEAESLVEHAAQAAHSVSDFELEADAQLLLATYASPTDSGQMDKLIGRIVEISTAHGFTYQLAAAYLDYGMLRIHQSRFAEAIPALNQAAHAAEQGGATLLYSIAVGDLATCYYKLGDFDRALALRKKAIAIQAKAGLQTALRDSYLELGASQFLQGDTAHAITSLEQALSKVDDEDSPESFSMIACKLASALESTGAVAQAKDLDQRALQVSKGAYPEVSAAVMLNEAAISERQGNPEAAKDQYLKAIELSSGDASLLWSSYAALGSLDARIGDADEARKNFEAAIRTIDASRTDQLQSKYKITFLSRLIRLYQEYVDVLLRRGDEQRALEIADSSRAAVLTQDPSGAQAPLRDDLIRRIRTISQRTASTFLFYWLAPGRSYLWVITGDGIKTIPLADGHEIAARVKSYRYLLEQEKIDPLASSHRLPSGLFLELVGPALQWIPKGAKVVIVPDDALHSLNFESLVVDDPRPHYWLEDVTISIAPSLGILTAAASHRVRSARSLLLVGDPEEAGTGYAKLPDAASEMERVSSHYSPGEITLRRGAYALPASYQAAHPARFSAIHFTTHAEANEQSPLDSAIILSRQKDGFRLYAREIMDIPLTAELVTLSACRGAGARTLSGEGSVGFAWAFFKAGAQNVVAGLWDVNDRSTSDLMDLFYTQVNEGRSYPAALRTAKLAILQTPYRKPYYWAPFQLYTRAVSSGN